MALKEVGKSSGSSRVIKRRKKEEKKVCSCSIVLFLFKLMSFFISSVKLRF